MSEGTQGRRDARIGPGTRIGKYEVVDRLGKGGQAVVYRARDARLEREVALKCPSPERANDEDHLRRFAREARSAAQIQHPNVVPVYEVFEQDGLPWIVMPIVAGQNLRQRVNAHGRLPPDAVVRMGEDLAAALLAAHTRRILHRDINPNNILIDEDGRALLADFGLARSLAGPIDSAFPTQSGPITEEGVVVGTPGFISPEQVLSRALDARSDLFSLGASLYFAATGLPPFVGHAPWHVCDAILHREPPAMREAAPDVPEPLERIVSRCLRKEPDARYPEAAELLADLRSLRLKLESGAVLDEPVSWWGREPRRARLAALAAALGILGLGLGLFQLVGRSPRGAAPAPLDRPFGVSRQVTSSPGSESRPALSPDGSLVAYTSDEAGNLDVWLVDVHGGKPLRLTDDPAADRDPCWLPNGSGLLFVSERGGEAGIWRVARLGGDPKLVLAGAVDPAVTPDGGRLAFARLSENNDFRIGVASLPEAADARLLTGEGDGRWSHRRPAWSPDGRQIVYQDFRTLWIVPTSGGRARRITEEGNGDRDPVFATDGASVLFTSLREGTQALWQVPLRGGAAVRLTMGTGPESMPSLSRDGSRLAYSTFAEQRDIALLDLATGERRRLPGARFEDYPAVAPDRSAVAFVSNRSSDTWDLWLQPLEGCDARGPARRLSDVPGSVAMPSFSPDGRWIACHRTLHGQRDIWLFPVDGTRPLALTDDPAPDVQPAWSPDGSRIAFSSEREGRTQIHVVTLRDGRAIAAPEPVSEGVGDDRLPAWSPDGSRLAFVRWFEDASDVWTVEPGSKRPAARRTRGAEARRVAWSARGDELLVSGTYGSTRVELRRFSAETGDPGGPVAELRFGDSDYAGQFSLSRDGTLLAYTEEAPSGDIWMLERAADQD